MEIIRIGNWSITDEGIIWCGEPKHNYLISKERLAEKGPPDRDEMYDWLVHMPEKAWLTREDVYALNTALIYALEYFGVGFPEDISFVKTFEEQKIVLRNK